MIDDFQADPKNHASNLLEELLSYVKNTPEEEFLEAKDYNTTYNEDKRLKCIFIKPEELEKKTIFRGEELNIFEKCIADRKNAGIGSNGYEGTAIYLFCQSDDEIEKAKIIVRGNKTEEVIVCIPKRAFYRNIFKHLKLLIQLRNPKIIRTLVHLRMHKLI